MPNDAPDTVFASDLALEARFSEFLANNSSSSVRRDGDHIVIENPWGDDTIVLRVPNEAKAAMAALNNLLLPPLFSGLFHRESGDLEFIYDPRKAEVHGRVFDFQFKGKAIRCEFGDCSAILKELAGFARPVAPPSHTDHRNLALFNLLRLREKDKENPGTSFWIRGIEWNEAFAIELARNLNFYMWYFDRQTPRIRIHERSRLEIPGKMPRYLFDVFPKVISARPLDPFLLQLWESGNARNSVETSGSV